MARRSWVKRILKGLGVLVLLVAGVVVFIGWRFMRTEMVQVDDHLHVLLGGGGNTLILGSDEGALVVDTKFAWPASALQKEVQRVTGKPAKMVVDTHWHPDHTHGNAKYPGAEFVGHTRTRAHMLDLDQEMFGPGAEGAAMVPTTLVEEGKQLQFGDDFVDIRYLGRGHTDGDVVVFLHRRSILHTGDLFVNGFFPVVDQRSGGSWRELGPTLKRVAEIGAAKIVPGHGPIAGPAELAKAVKYADSVWNHALEGAKSGKSRSEVVESFAGAEYDWGRLPGSSSLSKNLGEAYDEAQAFLGGGAKR